MQQFGHLFRNVLSLCLNIVAVVVCMGGGVWLFLIHYLGLAYAFELKGFDTMPLYLEPLVGPIFGALLPKADYTEGLGMVVSFSLTGLTLVFFHLFYQSLRLLFERVDYKRENNLEMVYQANRVLIENFILMIVVSLIVIPIFSWDIELFKFRQIAGALGITSSDVATSLTCAARQMQENGDLWVWSSLSGDARGYVFCVVAVSLLLEIAFEKLGNNFSRLMTNLELLFVGGRPEENKQPVFFGYDRDGQPVYDAGQTIAYDVNGHPVNSNQLQTLEPDMGSAGNPVVSNAGEPPFSTEAFHPCRNDNASVSAFCESDAGGNASNEVKTEVEVIGTDERVSIDLAKAQPDRYWIDPDTQQVWDVEFRNKLFANGGRQVA